MPLLPEFSIEMKLLIKILHTMISDLPSENILRQLNNTYLDLFLHTMLPSFKFLNFPKPKFRLAKRA